MKKCLFLILLLPFLSAQAPIHCPRQIASAVDKVFQLPEAQALLKEVQKEGPISIVVSRNGQFNAFWNGNLRQIIISAPQGRSEGSVIISLLMELNNASSDRELGRLGRAACRRQISRRAYVEGVERMEHQNALRVSEMLERGRRLGIFPSNASWSIPQRFDDYFYCQKRCGHSDWIGNSYDRMG